MESNLEILIDHYQKEVDYLKTSLETCISDGDFDGAKAFQSPLFYSSRKLDVLKSLSNPNFKKIRRLSGKIEWMEKYLNEDQTPLKEHGKGGNDYYKESFERKIKDTRKELQSLKNYRSTNLIDNDQILELLEKLEDKEIEKLEFPIIRDKIYLQLIVVGSSGFLNLKAHNNNKIENYIPMPTKSILRELQFDLEKYEKHIPNYLQTDKHNLLLELAIIFYEVFEVYENGISVRIS